jgi:hypothetical protein
MATPTKKPTEQHVISERVAEDSKQRVLLEKAPVAQQPYVQQPMTEKERLVLEKTNLQTGDTIRVIQEGGTSGITGAMRSISQGQVPSNADISTVVSKTDAAFDKRITDPSLPASTKKLVGDTKEFLHAAEQTLQEKNKGEHLQKMAYYAGQAGSDARLKAQQKAQQMRMDPNLRQKARAKKDKTKARSKEIGYGAYTVAKLSVRNQEFRHLILDIVRLLQEIFLRAVQFRKQQKEGYSQTLTGPSMVPSQPQMISQPVTQPQQFVQIQESTLQPAVFTSTGQELPYTTFSSGVTTTMPGITAPTMPSTGYLPGSLTEGPLTSQYWGEYEWYMPDYTLGQQQPQTMDWKSQIPQEKRRELATKVLELLRRFNTMPQFQTGLNALIQTFRDLERYSRKMSKSTDRAKLKLGNADKFYAEARALIEPYAPNKSMDSILENFRILMQDLRSNEEGKQYFRDIRDFLSTTMQSPEYMDDETATLMIEDFIDRGRDMMSDYRRRSETRRLLDDIKTLYYNIANDPTLLNLKQKTQTLLEDFMYQDANGKLAFNTELITDMRTVFVPILLETLDRVPLPIIEGTQKKMDFRVENLIFSAYDLLPENIQVKVKNEGQFNFANKVGPRLNYSTVKFKVNNLKTKMTDIKFWFRRHTFPKLEDYGTVDVGLAGSGMTLKIKTMLRSTSTTPKFSITQVKCFIDRLDIHFHKDAKYDWLENFGAKLFRKRIKRSIEIQIENKIREYGLRIERGLNKMMKKYPPERLKEMARNRMERGREHRQHLKEGSATNMPVQSTGEMLKHGLEKTKEKVKEKLGTTGTTTSGTTIHQG